MEVGALCSLLLRHEPSVYNKYLSATGPVQFSSLEC